MNLRSTCSFALLLALSACSARGSSGGGGPIDEPDASTDGQIAVDDVVVTPDGDPIDVSFPTDVPVTPDGTVTVDVPVTPDRPVTPDVPVTMDVPSSDPCTQLCQRGATAPGCPSDLTSCVNNCQTSLTRLPASCRSTFDALVACARTSPITCSGTTPTFSACGAEQTRLTNCLLPDGGTPDVPTTTGDPTAACTGTFGGPDRECGWSRGGVLSCTPGRTVTVGCNSTAGTGTLCTSTIGSCTGDPVLRVCPGTTPCSATTELTSADDTCGTCPVVSVTCPTSGSVLVLVGPYSSTTAGTCVPQLR
jgi:hypothetical protein